MLEAGGIDLGHHLTPAGLWEALLDHYGDTLHPYGISEVTTGSTAPNYTTPDAHTQHVAAPEPDFSGDNTPLPHEPASLETTEHTVLDDGTGGAHVESDHHLDGGTGGGSDDVDGGDSVFDDMADDI